MIQGGMVGRKFSGFLERNHFFLVMTSQLRNITSLLVKVQCSVPKRKVVSLSSEGFVELKLSLQVRLVCLDVTAHSNQYWEPTLFLLETHAHHQLSTSGRLFQDDLVIPSCQGGLHGHVDLVHQQVHDVADG